MRPNTMANANTGAAVSVGSGGGGVGAGPNANINSSTASNGVTIPINHEYVHQPPQQQPGYYADPNAPAYGSPRQQPQQQPIPAHFQQGFGFEPDMDMDMDMGMFPRTRLGRMHDPFANFGTSAHFGFPQFGSLGRRRAADSREDDFFNRLPSEFRQYMPEGFGQRRAGSGATAAAPGAQQPQSAGPGGQYFQYASTPPSNGAPQSPTKKVCDAAIQTEDPMDRADTVDCAAPLPTDNLKQHGLRNTVDMGIKSATESDGHGPRSHSAPPNEQQPQQQPQQQQPVNGKRQTPPPHAGQSQFGTQTSPHVQAGAGQQPQFQKAYYPPQQQSHPQQRQQTPPPPQTPGGTYVRTIPIFVEGRSEPIINSHKEIPTQSGAVPSANASASASASASARAHAPSHQPQQQQQYYQQPPFHHPQQHQHQHRPTPLNTQHQPPQHPHQHQHPQQQRQQTGPPVAGDGVPPETPNTLDSINKIQDIQRDVLALMGQVEKFGGTRKDKQYAYLDEMLTRNLLKLDTIDTNGKESIRLARKEAIKCIQASINVLEAKAEENVRLAQQAQQSATAPAAADNGEAATQKSASNEAMPAAAEGAEPAEVAEPQPADATKIQEPIPLPPPEGMQVDESAPAGHGQVADSGNESQKEMDTSALADTEAALQTATAEASSATLNNESK